MSYETQIEMLICSDNKRAYNELKELLLICEHSNDLYMYFDKFVDMMNNKTNSFIRTRGLRLIAYNAKWDKENKVNSIIEQWLRHMEDEKAITARQCIQDVIVIAKYKPELLDVILNALESFDQIYDDSMQKLVYKDRLRAIKIIRQYTW
ncbi:MAG: hypothetical protein RR428_00725 [Coprobacillus sp.]